RSGAVLSAYARSFPTRRSSDLNAIALVRVGWRFRRRAWYRRVPFLPLPSREYVRWRMHTAYGRDDAVPPADDVIRYARWATRDRSEEHTSELQSHLNLVCRLLL